MEFQLERRPFTKAMVKVIEDRFGVKLTAEQIASGSVKVEYKNYCGWDTVVTIERSWITNKTVHVRAKYTDGLTHADMVVGNADLKNALRKTPGCANIPVVK